MKKFKIIVGVSIILLFLLILVFRIIKLRSYESQVTYLYRELAIKNGLLAAEYVPVLKQVKIQDSVSFTPGTVWIHEPMEVKHTLFLSNPYYVKSSNSKRTPSLHYSSDNNDDNFMFSASKTDSASYVIYFNKDGEPRLDDYTLKYELLDKEGRGYKVADYKMVDTLKFYIKKAIVTPEHPWTAASGTEYVSYKVSLSPEPLDSILYIKKR